MRNNTTFLIAFCIAAFSLIGFAARATAAEKTNIVFILSDDKN